MRRALGGGPEALAFALAALWLVATVGVPLEHALRHAVDPAGHCHHDGGVEVCHGGERAPATAPQVRDAGLPDLGSFSVSHGAIAFLACAALAVLPALQSWLAIAFPLNRVSQPSDAEDAVASARGPPSAASLIHV